MAATYRASGASEACWEALGYAVLGPVAMRYDQIEQLSARLYKEARGGPFAETDGLVRLAGCSGAEFAIVLARLGFRSKQGKGDTPTHFSPKRRPGKSARKGQTAKDGKKPQAVAAKRKTRKRRGSRAEPAFDHTSPFAALKDLVTAK
jgi:hypothetical protein